MEQKMTQKELVRNFVQNVLGCGCPEGVFEEIEVKQGPVDIDDRLHLHVIDSQTLPPFL